MGTLSIKVLRFIGRHVVNFSIIALILALGPLLYAEAKEKWAEQSAYDNWLVKFDGFVQEARDKAVKRTGQAKEASLAELRKQIQIIDAEIAANNARRPSKLLPNGFIENQKIDITNLYLGQEKEFLVKLHDRLVAIANLGAAKARLEQLRRFHVVEYAAYSVHENAHQAFMSQPLYQRLIQLGRAMQLDADHRDLVDRTIQANDAYQAQNAVITRLAIPTLPTFLPNDAGRKEIKDKLESTLGELQKHWLVKARVLLEGVAWQALFILVGVLLMPLAIKSVFYFVIAPIASRRPSVRIAAAGADAPACWQMGKISAVSADIDFGRDEELLLQPEFVHSLPSNCAVDTKGVLSYRFFLSSLVAGMYGLSRFRTDSWARIVACATNDPLAEIAVIEIPEGSGVVLEPHNLIGVVQHRGREMRIERHWHLTSSTAWLTLHLRSLVFFGPGRLIVKGCRGVKVEQSDGSRSINQGATIGYSANLTRSVLRCQAFWPYLKGDEELFNDRYDGEGVCIYAESPYLGKNKGFYGKGIEGVVDSVLKVFGI